jgi:putative oxidoreductase
MLENVALKTLVPLLLRAALAVVFIFHGLDHVRVGGGFTWANQMPDPPPEILQAAVAWGQLAGGIALALGLFTRLAAIGIIAVMVGAILKVHLPHGFDIRNQGYEYNLVLIVIAVCLVISGGGTLSMDRIIKVKSRGPAKY